MPSLLLIDDTAAMRALVRAYVQHDNAWTVVEEATNAREGITAAARLAPDVIVLDQQMPDMTGLEALPALRASNPQARIVVWSSEHGIATEALRLGADAFVDKLDSPEVLLAALTH